MVVSGNNVIFLQAEGGPGSVRIPSRYPSVQVKQQMIPVSTAFAI